VGTITGLNYWTGLLDYWTGLLDSPKTAKYNPFSAEQKLNLLISSVTSLTLLFPGVSRGQRLRAYLTSFTLGGCA